MYRESSVAYAKDLESTPTLKTSPIDDQPAVKQEILPSPAYTGCSLQSLRFLASFIIHQASSHSLDLAGFFPQLALAQTSCEKIHILTALARSKQEGAHLLDHFLTLLVEPEARSYRSMAPCALAQSWESSPETLRGRNLAAFLWVLIKNSSVATRRIEEKVLRSVEFDCFQLLVD